MHILYYDRVARLYPTDGVLKLISQMFKKMKTTCTDTMQ
jgi:hypothetical protein